MALTLRGDGPATVVSRMALLSGVTLALYSPWLYWCWRNFRRFTQVSGEILTYKHHVDIMGRRVSPRGLARAGTFGALSLAYTVDRFLGFAAGSRVLTIAFAAFTGGVLASGAVDPAALRGASGLAFLGLFLGIHLLFYGGWLWRTQDWYLLSTGLVAAVFAGVGALALQEVNIGAGVNGLVVAGAMGVTAFAIIGAWMSLRDRRTIDHPQRYLYRAAEWIRDNTEKDALVASINTGIMAFFSERTVLNLSGAVNNPAAEAIHQGKLLDYVHRAGVQYLVDFESSLNAFRNCWGEDPRPHLKTVETLGGWFRGGSMKVFRVLKGSEAGPPATVERIVERSSHAR